MPITPFVHGREFDPDAVRAMGIAFESACRSLGLTDKTDKATELVAARIIQFAERGELDPDRLAAAVLSTFKPC